MWYLKCVTQCAIGQTKEIHYRMVEYMRSCHAVDVSKYLSNLLNSCISKIHILCSWKKNNYWWYQHYSYRVNACVYVDGANATDFIVFPIGAQPFQWVLKSIHLIPIFCCPLLRYSLCHISTIFLPIYDTFSDQFYCFFMPLDSWSPLFSHRQP